MTQIDLQLSRRRGRPDAIHARKTLDRIRHRGDDPFIHVVRRCAGLREEHMSTRRHGDGNELLTKRHRREDPEHHQGAGDNATNPRLARQNLVIFPIRGPFDSAVRRRTHRYVLDAMKPPPGHASRSGAEKHTKNQSKAPTPTKPLVLEHSHPR